MAGFLPAKDLATFMQPNSLLNGHPARTKIEAVEASTGPLGHGLPIAVGTAFAGKLDGSPRRTFVVVGDGELQEGSNWEALMTAGNHRLEHLCVVVDRNRLQQGAKVADTNDLEPLADKLAAFGFDVVEVDGHDHAALLDAFESVPSASGRPTAVVARTHKGYPISFMQDNVAWHHKVPYRRPGGPGARRAVDRPGGIVTTTGSAPVESLHDCRDAWVAALTDLAAADDRIVAVVNDSVGSSKLGPFQERFPDRLVNVGIAEQDMVGIGAGLANGGKIPFVSAAACFLTARAMEQIKVDAAYSRHHLVLVGQSPGMAYGELGPTHHSIEDLGWLRLIPDLTVVVPSDPTETYQAVTWAASHPGPVYIRVSRMGVPDVNPAGYQFRPGKAVTLREGTDVTVVATGVTVVRALRAADELAREGIEARVLSMPTIKPLDTEAVEAAARETGGIVTVEEALTSGLGGAVAEAVVTRHPTAMRFVGVPDTFAPTGAVEWLLDHFGISSPGIQSAVRDLLGR